jgi:hypothetical protein
MRDIGRLWSTRVRSLKLEPGLILKQQVIDYRWRWSVDTITADEQWRFPQTMAMLNHV